MSKSVEQAVHDIDIPQPGMAGEDFESYLHRVLYVGFMAGAAWAITNGPQVQPPQPVHEPEHEIADDEQPLPTTSEAGNPVNEPEWMTRPEGEVTDGPMEQDAPSDVVTETE